MLDEILQKAEGKSGRSFDKVDVKLVGDWLRDKINRLKNNIWALIGLFFLLPTIVSLVVVFMFNSLLDFKNIRNFMDVSGYFFTFSSLVLVFILLETFRISDYKKSVVNKSFLENDAINQLINSLDLIQKCILEEKVDDLYQSCRNVDHIYKSLKTQEDDVVLSAYSNQIGHIYNLLNRNYFFTFSYDYDVRKLKNIPTDVKQNIVSKVDDLSRELSRTIKQEGTADGEWRFKCTT